MPAFTLDEVLSRLKAWVTFAGCVLIVAVLYWAQTVIVPIALALLLTFVLNPPVTWLERRIGKVAAVMVAGALVCGLLGLAAYGLSRQIDHLADDLPRYRGNIREKIADIRGAGKGSSVEKIQETLDQIKSGLDQSPPPRGSVTRPVVVQQEPSGGFLGIAWLGPVMGPLSKAALILTLVIFMLFERRDLRDRVIGLVGHGQLAITTKAFDEASARVSRQLLMQTLVNVIYGASAAFGLYALHVPYAFVWGALGGALRFIPYVGPVVGAGAPILVSLAAMPGWTGPFWVMGLFLVLELITNLVLETKLYAGAAGVSQVALLVSVAFWTFLWGPLGLLMATPLTVCLVVMGKHVPGLRIFATLMSDTPPLAPEYGFYQRLLARDVGEAADLIERHATASTASALSVYDALMVPALNYAELDRLEQRLSLDDRDAVLESTRELLPEAAEAARRQAEKDEEHEDEAERERESEAERRASTPRRQTVVLAHAVGGASDEIALAMFKDLLADTPFRLEPMTAPVSASSLVGQVRDRCASIVLFVDLPPSAPSRTRHLVKRLRAAAPETRIVVGRWAPPLLADEGTQVLREAGATFVGSTLSETRAYLLMLLDGAQVAEAAPTKKAVAVA